jgi:uncharacterized protein with GYD domain
MSTNVKRRHTERFVKRVFELMRTASPRIAAVQDVSQATGGDMLAVVASIGGSDAVKPFLRHSRRVLTEAVEIAIAEQGLPKDIVFGRYEIEL